MPALGLVDHDNLFGSLEFSEYAVKEGIQPIIGLTVSLVPYGADSPSAALRATPDQLLLLYAKDERGYLNLLQLGEQGLYRARAWHERRCWITAMLGAA